MLAILAFFAFQVQLELVLLFDELLVSVLGFNTGPQVSTLMHMFCILLLTGSTFHWEGLPKDTTTP